VNTADSDTSVGRNRLGSDPKQSSAIKAVPEVCHIICASANLVQVIIAESDQGRGILGVIDGYSPKGIESEADIEDRKTFLRTIGYKL